MKTITNYLTAVTAVLTLSGSALTAADGWIEDFEAAKVKAAKEKKDLFLEFTGSDWCPPCKMMHANIYSKPAFLKPAAEAFILVSLDYPRQTEQDAKIKKQNEGLAQGYKVRGFPSVVLADKDGNPYHVEVGGRQETAEVYTKRIIGQKSVRTDRDAALAAAAKENGLEKAKLIKKALDTMSPETVESFYSDKVDEIIKLDKDDALGLKKEQEAKKKIEALDQALQELAQAGKHEEHAAKVDAFIAENKLEGSMKQDVLMRKFQLIGPDKLDLAEKLADEIVKIDASTEPGKMAANIKQQIAKMKAAKKPTEPATEAVDK